MPRDGAIIFRDLVGNLGVLNVECDKCGRRGRYHLYRLIERYGIERAYRMRYRIQVQRADDS
jgi:hypothetical protein